MCMFVLCKKHSYMHINSEQVFCPNLPKSASLDQPPRGKGSPKPLQKVRPLVGGKFIARQVVCIYAQAFSL